jgi:hypothetical protein
MTGEAAAPSVSQSRGRDADAIVLDMKEGISAAGWEQRPAETIRPR